MKEVYVVFGYANTGSGSLTWPEDFTIEGFYESKKDAQSHCDRLNEENGAQEDDLPDDYDGTVYTVETVKNLKK